jgi:RNA polymerase sigma factor (sigma-70 family)
MDPPTPQLLMTDTGRHDDSAKAGVKAKASANDSEITATVMRERSKLGSFIRRRVRDQTEAEDILQDVFYEFVEACRLPAPIEHASAWLYRVARHRIIDRYRKKREESLSDLGDVDDEQVELRLDLAMPAPGGGPEAEYARSVLMKALLQALDELPQNQREVFVEHELGGSSFKEMAARSGLALSTLLSRKHAAVLYLRVRLQSIYDELEF